METSTNLQVELRAATLNIEPKGQFRLEEVPLSGNTRVDLIKGKAMLQGIRFTTTSYMKKVGFPSNFQGQKIHLLLLIVAKDGVVVTRSMRTKMIIDADKTKAINFNNANEGFFSLMNEKYQTPFLLQPSSINSMLSKHIEGSNMQSLSVANTEVVQPSNNNTPNDKSQIVFSRLSPPVFVDSRLTARQKKVLQEQVDARLTESWQPSENLLSLIHSIYFASTLKRSKQVTVRLLRSKLTNRQKDFVLFYRLRIFEESLETLASICYTLTKLFVYTFPNMSLRQEKQADVYRLENRHT